MSFWWRISNSLRVKLRPCLSLTLVESVGLMRPGIHVALRVTHRRGLGPGARMYGRAARLRGAAVGHS